MILEVGLWDDRGLVGRLTGLRRRDGEDGVARSKGLSRQSPQVQALWLVRY